jgi:hypothetical protein
MRMMEYLSIVNLRVVLVSAEFGESDFEFNCASCPSN